MFFLKYLFQESIVSCILMGAPFPVASVHLSCLVYMPDSTVTIPYIPSKCSSMVFHWHKCVDTSISQVSPFTIHRPHPETHKISQNHPTLSYPSACLTKSYQTSTHFPSQNKRPMPPLPPLATIMDSPTSSAGVKWHRLIVDEMIIMS